MVAVGHVTKVIALILCICEYLCKLCLFLFFQNLKAQGVWCSVIALAAEIHVCCKLCHETGVLFGVILDNSHFQDQLFQHVDLPPAATFLDSYLIRWGFHITWYRRERRCYLLYACGEVFVHCCYDWCMSLVGNYFLVLSKLPRFSVVQQAVGKLLWMRNWERIESGSVVL